MVTISILAVLIVWGLIAKLYVGSRQRTDVMLAWGMATGGAVLFYGVVGSLIALVDETDRASSIMVNGDTYLCEAPVIDYDLDWYWPGLSQERYDENPDNATCYLVGEDN